MEIYRIEEGMQWGPLTACKVHHFGDDKLGESFAIIDKGVPVLSKKLSKQKGEPVYITETKEARMHCALVFDANGNEDDVCGHHYDTAYCAKEEVWNYCIFPTRPNKYKKLENISIEPVVIIDVLTYSRHLYDRGYLYPTNLPANLLELVTRKYPVYRGKDLDPAATKPHRIKSYNIWQPH